MKPVFVTFATEETKLLNRLLDTVNDPENAQKPLLARYTPDELIPSGEMGSNDRHMKTLMSYGLVALGDTVYEGVPCAGYALTVEGYNVACHLATEASIPAYVKGGWQQELIDMVQASIDKQAPNHVFDYEAESRQWDAEYKWLKGLVDRLGSYDRLSDVDQLILNSVRFALMLDKVQQ